MHSIDTIEAAIDGSDSILDAYSTPNAKSTNKRLHTTPDKYAAYKYFDASYHYFSVYHFRLEGATPLRAPRQFSSSTEHVAMLVSFVKH